MQGHKPCSISVYTCQLDSMNLIFRHHLNCLVTFRCSMNKQFRQCLNIMLKLYEYNNNKIDPNQKEYNTCNVHHNVHNINCYLEASRTQKEFYIKRTQMNFTLNSSPSSSLSPEKNKNISIDVRCVCMCLSLSCMNSSRSKKGGT